MPNFLIIGTAKAGTTSLHYYLDEHPQIYVSPKPEPMFFAFDGETVDYRGPFDDRYQTLAVTRLEDYQALFANVSEERAVGEASPFYLYSAVAPKRIRHHLPGAKLIVVLRDPTERAFAQFLSERRDGREPLPDFAAAIEAEAARIRDHWAHPYHYVGRGFYAEQIARYLELFSRHQIRIYLHEDLRADNRRVLRDIFQFLGVDEAFLPDLSLHHNVGGLPRSAALHKLLHGSGFLKSLGNAVLPVEWRRRMKLKASNMNLVKPELPNELRRKLVALYHDDILRLEALIERDLSAWRRV